MSSDARMARLRLIMYVDMYAYTYIDIYIYIYVCVYIYTYTCCIYYFIHVIFQDIQPCMYMFEYIYLEEYCHVFFGKNSCVELTMPVESD